MSKSRKKQASKKAKKQSNKKQAPKKAKKQSNKKQAPKKAKKQSNKKQASKKAKKQSNKKQASKKAKKQSNKKQTSKKQAKKKIPAKKKADQKKIEKKPIKKTTELKKSSSKEFVKHQPVQKAKPRSKASSSHYLEERKLQEFRKELDRLENKEKQNILIKDVQGRIYCQDDNCDQPAVTENFCRQHYLYLWPYVYNRKKILENKQLFEILNKIVKNFGKAGLLSVMKDCKTEKSFEFIAKEMNFPTSGEGTSSDMEKDY